MLHYYTITSTLPTVFQYHQALNIAFQCLFFFNNDLLLKPKILKNPTEDLDHTSMSLIIIRQLFKKSQSQEFIYPLDHRILVLKGPQRFSSLYSFILPVKKLRPRDKAFPLFAHLERSGSLNQTQVCFSVTYSQSKNKCIFIQEDSLEQSIHVVFFFKSLKCNTNNGGKWLFSM